MKVLSLNLQCGKYLDGVLSYLQSKINDIDIFAFQEVAGGYRYALQFQTVDFSENNFLNIDVFFEIKNCLGDAYEGFLTKAYTDKSGKNYVGSAVFIRKNKIKKNIFKNFFMGNQKIIDSSEKNHNKVRYVAQFFEFEIQNGFTFYLVNIHMLKYKSYEILSEKYFQELSKEVEKTKEPIILIGDFNIDREHFILDKYFNKLRNINSLCNIENTLNNNRHLLFERHPNHIGYSVDQMLCSKSFCISYVKVEKKMISDHYPIIFKIKE